MSNQLEDDLRRVLRLARAEAKTNKLKSSGKGNNINKVHQRHRHDQHLTGSKGERHTLLTAKLQGLSAIYGLDASSRHLGLYGSKSVLCHQHKDDPEEDDEILQQRLDARRTLYKRHYAGALADSSGRKRDMEHVLEAAVREARSSRALGVGIGAAILTKSQTIYAAGAVESGAMALCAERAAVVKMLTSGTTANPVVMAMAICSEQHDMLPFPCGACRELLADCGDFPVYLVNALGETEETRSSTLFPRARHSELTKILAQSQPSKSERTPARTKTAVASPDRTPLEVKDWTTENVVRWLERDVELPQYRDVFERNAVDGCTLVLLEASDLQLLLGITHPLHRSKLLTHVDRLRDRELLARGLDYTQLEDYLAVLDIDRVSAVAQLKTTFDRLDADHDGFLDFNQVKQALSRLRCTIPAVSKEADPDSNTVGTSAQAIERLLHSENLFGKEAATSGKVPFPAFARAFSKLATQPADTPTVTQGAFAVHAFGPRLPVLDLSNLRKCFEQQGTQGASLDEPGLVRLLKELGQSEARSTELACRWLDAQDEVDEASEGMSFAQFIARYAQLIDNNTTAEGAEATGVARLQQLFTSYEPVHSTRWKPRTVVQRALSTLFPTVPNDEVSVWCASFWPSKLPKANENGHNSGSTKQATTTLSFPEFTLACLEFAAEAYAREHEAATIKRSLRNDALAHRSRVVHLHNSGHVRMCPQIASATAETGSKQDPSKTRTLQQERKTLRRMSRDSDEEDGKRADTEGKAQDSDDEGRNQQNRRRGRREQQVNEAFDRFAWKHGAQTRSTKDNGTKPNSDDEEDESCFLNAVEAAQAALELGGALSREQVIRFLEREGLGRIRRRDISRLAFHRLMKRLDANQCYPRDLLLDIDNRPGLRQQREASASPRKDHPLSKSPRHRAYKSKPDYDEFLRQKLARSNGTQWEKEVDALRCKKQRREQRRTKKGTKKYHRSSYHGARKNDSDDDGKHDSDDEGKHDSDSTGSIPSDSSSRSGPRRHRRTSCVSRSRSRSRHRARRHHHRQHRSSSSEASTETDTSSTESSQSSTHRRVRRRGFEPGARVASMIHGRGTVERVYRDYFVADVHFDNGRHLRNIEFSGLRVLDPEDELLSGAPKAGFAVGSRVSVAHKGTKTRRQGKIVLCRTDGTFDVLVNEFGAAQTLKRIARSALALTNVQPTVYRVGDRVMVRQRTEYLRGKVCTCRTDGSYDVKLARSPQKIIPRLAPQLLTPDDGVDGDSEDDVDETEKDPPANSKPTPPSKKVDSDDDFEPEFARGDRVEARFGGQAAYYRGTIERVHPNGSCDISYDDGDEEERVAPRLIRSNPAARKPPPSKKKPSSDNGYDSDLFDSD